MQTEARVIAHTTDGKSAESPRWWLMRATRTAGNGCRLATFGLNSRTDAAPTLAEAFADLRQRYGLGFRPSARDEFCLVLARRQLEAELAFFDEPRAQRQAS
jgi:hypothetical protein